MNSYNIKKFGAKGNGTDNDAEAIQAAISTCSQEGGGQVVVPSGHTYLTGPFKLQSNVELHVQRGAKILAHPDESLYTESAFRDNLGEGTIWIGGEDIENVTISGGGEIDGNGVAFMGPEEKDAYVLKPFDIVDPRPHLLTIINCRNLKLTQVTFKGAAYWGLHIIGCHDVAISDLTILNSLKVRNADGIDLDHSKNVRITNCHIESGDDSICIKNRREYAEYGNCENITVSNCTLISTSCAIKLGSENVNSINHVTFNNCIIRDSNRGIGIQNRDEGTVSDIIFANMMVDSRLFSDVWWGKAEPIYITAYPREPNNDTHGGKRFPKGETKGRAGQVKDITFSNIRCTSENGIFIGGDTPEKISNIYLNDINIGINKRTVHEGGHYDCRPREGEGMISGSTSAFYFDTASNIHIHNARVSWGDNKPSYYNYAVESHRVEQLSITNLTGSSATPESKKAICIDNTEYTNNMTKD